MNYQFVLSPHCNRRIVVLSYSHTALHVLNSTRMSNRLTQPRCFLPLFGYRWGGQFYSTVTLVTIMAPHFVLDLSFRSDEIHFGWQATTEDILWRVELRPRAAAFSTSSSSPLKRPVFVNARVKGNNCHVLELPHQLPKWMWTSLAGAKKFTALEQNRKHKHKTIFSKSPTGMGNQESVYEMCIEWWIKGTEEHNWAEGSLRRRSKRIMK